MSTAPVNQPAQRTFLGHPIGLYILFFTEMWERFSYYGMRALLMLYMLNYFKWAQKDASTIYKVYTSFVYVTPILGGFLADRYLGNRKAVIIGAVLMSIGHFLMAFEEYPIFMAALVFLILGNGFFKPNMSTQVGRLYPSNDGRLDGAYTIFYMGINLGAFLSPIICGWLVANTVGGYHSGFTMAGIGMVLGMAIYLLGQPFIKEIPPAEHLMGGTLAQKEASGAMTEAEASQTPSVLGGFSQFVPHMLAILGLASIGAGAAAFIIGKLEIFDMLMAVIGGSCLILVAYVTTQVVGGMRDRVLAILILGIFVIFFWAAFEQAGNVLNVWADQNTNRYLTHDFKPPVIAPEVTEDPPKTAEEQAAQANAGFFQRFVDLFVNMVTLKESRDPDANLTWLEWIEKNFNPMPTEWFQSINALGIFVLAPLFAFLWTWLDRRALQPSIPLKMVLGLIMMSAAMAMMMAAANQENKRTTVAWTQSSLPSGLELKDGSQLARKDAKGHVEVFHAGRLGYNQAEQKLLLDGVLPENERDLLIETTAPEAYAKAVKALAKESKKIDGKEVKSVEVVLNDLPPGFDMKFAGIKTTIVKYLSAAAGGPKLVAYKELAEKEVKGLLVAGGDPAFRSTIHDLATRASTFSVSPWWLFWTYILATLGELCLSPVGLSMVSKLAPAKFSTMLMGVWLLISAFGNFAAGLLGEVWGTIPPIDFFMFSTVVVGAAALILVVFVKMVTRTMHGVK